jgi:hypothetical protein
MAKRACWNLSVSRGNSYAGRAPRSAGGRQAHTTEGMSARTPHRPHGCAVPARGALRWLAGREKMFRIGRHACVATNEFDPKSDIATLHQTWFVAKGRLFRKQEVTVRQRAYRHAKIGAPLASSLGDAISPFRLRRYPPGHGKWVWSRWLRDRLVRGDLPADGVGPGAVRARHRAASFDHRTPVAFDGPNRRCEER